MLQTISRTRSPKRLSESPRFFPFFATVVVVQGVHVIEHIIQLLQVTVFDVPDDKALGLLGYLIQFNGTEEYLHFGFNLLYLTSLYVLAFALMDYTAAGVVPRWAFKTFIIAGVGLESWHMTEHMVIIYHVIRNHGCPCPGIGDRALNVSDTVLHFFYNTIAYAATVVPFWFVVASRPNRWRLSARVGTVG